MFQSLNKLVVSIACTLAWLTAAPALAQRSTPVQVPHPSGAPGDRFGSASAVDGDTMIVGASDDDVGPNASQGSAHIYRWTGTGWAFEATLTASDGAADDRFGASVAISGDTVVVGARNDDIGANINQGSAYIFARTPGSTTWTQQAKLTASDGAQADQLGRSVAILGDVVVAGASGDDIAANINQGSAYIFIRTPGSSTWTQQAKLTASDAAADDNFGGSVALSGDTLVVSATDDDIGGAIDQGSAYVFTRTGSAWTQQAKLVASDGAPDDLLGLSLAINGDTVAVGTYNDDIGGAIDQGSVYVFTRNASTWTQQAKLVASDGAMEAYFAESISLSGDTMLVGAGGATVGGVSGLGAAYVFTRPPGGTAWTQQAKLTAPGSVGDGLGASVGLSGDTAVVGSPNANDAAGTAWVFSRVGSRWIGPDFQALATGGATFDNFGYSVAISGDTAIVGAYTDDVGSIADQGSAYIFTRSGSTWTQQAQLNATGGATNDQFGYSVAISGDTAIVGARYDDVGANLDQGSAYVFTRSGSTWTQQTQLTAIGGAATAYFGWAVAFSGDTALVGAVADDVGANAVQGSAYIFTRSGSTWTQQAQLTASDGAEFDIFGYSVALSGDTAIVGAYLDDVGANADQGSAYIFTRSGSTWTQQAQLTANTGAALDEFGTSVTLSGDTAIVGARLDDVGSNADQGSAYIFTRSGSTWTQQAQLNASGGAAGDNFGYAVALSGDAAIVGAWLDDVGANSNQGSAYVFTRSGSTWTQQAQLNASGGAANDLFGASVALSGDAAIVGAFGDDVGANSNQGSAWFLDFPANDFASARNDTTGAGYATLAAALLPAISGQQITATEAAWRTTGGSVSTLGRSLALLGVADVRTPSTSIIDLGGASLLAATAGSIDIYGQLRTASSSSADLFADAFTLGSRGSLTARTNSSLTVNAPAATLQGQTRVEQYASLNFLGSATATGSTTVGANASVLAGNTFTNIDTFTITSGTITTPLFDNRSLLNVFGSSAIFGSFTNDAGAVTTIRSGTLFVFGSLTNNGTILGTLCSNCLATPPNLDVGGSLVLGPDANLNFPFADSLISVGGDFDNAINSNARVDTALATLQLQGSSGGSVEQTLEVMSTNIGRNLLGLDRTLEGHYPIGTLHIGPSPSTVRLVDTHDNDTLGQSQPEAIYVDTLRIDAGSRLINESNIIYYNTLIADGVVDVPENLRSLACRADVDGVPGVDFGDFLVYFNCFDTEQPCADVDGNPGVDFGDFLAFFNDFDAGCL